MNQSPPPLPQKDHKSFHRKLIITSVSVFFLIIIGIIVSSVISQNNERRRLERVEYEERQSQLRFEKARDQIESTMRSDLRRCFSSSKLEEYDIYEDGSGYILEASYDYRAGFFGDGEEMTCERTIRYDSKGNFKRCLTEDRY